MANFSPERGKIEPVAAILVIVPAYNEEATVARVVEEVKTFFPEAEVLVVDDGSEDATAEEALRAGAKVLRLPFNVGVGGAVQAGYLYAQRCGYRIAVQMDGDGQHNAADLPALLAPLLAGEADMVVGSRFLNPHSYRSTPARRLGIVLLRNLISWLSRQRFTDPTSGFRAVGPELIRFFARHYPYEYPEAESLLLAKRQGFRLREVPVTMRPRQGGVSSLSGWRSFYFMAKVLLAVGITALRRRERVEADGK
ncbi:glycosyl transferase family 2 [Ammonifex degensii KC4]|uniref:Glycosyl transferase family 2 n=1 Tax=Ammonifex degensii (strain DSM 10501 / KC4) TaxID=429009 RepID=C9RAI9_AMMDK|nr:glycosyltransferase family 2 protein [Ammonifex degensii]ACX51266.1 glycosyl transferase family 2 [Ammonifex degensii KC4]